jgi:hypothetical protein
MASEGDTYSDPQLTLQFKQWQRTQCFGKSDLGIETSMAPQLQAPFTSVWGEEDMLRLAAELS